MRLIIVPHSSDLNSARIWLGAVDSSNAPADFSLTVEGAGAVPVPQANWRPVTAGDTLTPAESQVFVQTVNVTGLSSGTRFVVQGLGAKARFATLPERLPSPGGQSFNVLLSSCFFIDRNRGDAVGAAVAQLPEHHRPDVKILCGDQVYLDFPAFILGLPFTEHGLGRSLLGKYRQNWSDEAGYQKLLAEGSSYFTSDDHEFWNNYPNAATIISNTWFASGREKLKKVARPLFQDFQCEAPELAGRNRVFDVPPVSFFVADTRLNRGEGDDEFMQPGDLNEMTAWIRGLTGPGVLVVGQPIFEEPAGFFAKRFTDKTLPNYKQYTPLVKALSEASHSILILSGDVHYGRVATVAFRRDGSGPRISEVIASPSSLVAGFPGDPKKVKRFPPEATGIPEAVILEKTGGTRAGDHFATLRFTATDRKVTVGVTHWYLRESGGVKPGDEVTLELL
jgi:hypothetical protein